MGSLEARLPVSWLRVEVGLQGNESPGCRASPRHAPTATGWLPRPERGDLLRATGHLTPAGRGPTQRRFCSGPVRSCGVASAAASGLFVWCWFFPQGRRAFAGGKDES